MSLFNSNVARKQHTKKLDDNILLLLLTWLCVMFVGDYLPDDDDVAAFAECMAHIHKHTLIRNNNILTLAL